MDSEKIIASWKEQTEKIGIILGKETPLCEEEIENIGTLFSKKKVYIEDVKKIFETAKIKNNTELISRINAVLEEDKRNITLLEKRLNEISEKLRNLIRQKSLLIYTEK